MASTSAYPESGPVQHYPSYHWLPQHPHPHITRLNPAVRLASAPQDNAARIAPLNPTAILASTPQQIRPDRSGIWSTDDDETLLVARARNERWSTIASKYFRGKSGNACRKRYERLKKKEGGGNDAQKLDIIAREYLTMRQVMWKTIADRCGGDWKDVERTCFEQGLNNLKTIDRRAHRLKRFESEDCQPHDSALGLDYGSEDDGIPRQKYNEISAENGEGSNNGPRDEIQNEMNGIKRSSKEEQGEEQNRPGHSVEASSKGSTSNPAGIGSNQEDGEDGSLQPQLLTDLSETSTGDERLAFLLEKHKVLKSLMREFHVLFDTSSRTTQPEDTEIAPSEPQTTTSRSTAQPLLSSGSSAKGKRRLQDDGSSPPDDDRNDDRRKRTRRTLSTAKDHEGLYFACPFFKYDPRKYSCTSKKRCQYRTCAGPGFQSIARLKQHLKRIHRALPQCPRCWACFNDQSAVSAHAREGEQCEILSQQISEGISSDKWDLITSTRGPSWNDIFEFIFPGAPIPTPYYEAEPQIKSPVPPTPVSQEMASFEAFQRAELPSLVEATMDVLIQSGTVPFEEQYKFLLPGVIRSCLSILSSKWQLVKDSFSQTNFLSHSPCPVGSSTLTAIHIPPKGGPTSSISAPPGSSSLVPSFYQEPRHLTEEDATADPRVFERNPDATTALPRPDDPGHAGYIGSLNQTPEYCSCDINLVDIVHNLEGSGAASLRFNDSGYLSVDHSLLLEPGVDFQDESAVRCFYCDGRIRYNNTAPQ